MVPFIFLKLFMTEPT